MATQLPFLHSLPRGQPPQHSVLAIQEPLQSLYPDLQPVFLYLVAPLVQLEFFTVQLEQEAPVGQEDKV